ncbi:putative Nuclear movement protein [Leptomonas pyrrhocoris]|uniref:Putative Nuclear movement protein n=1 Tax=Leptomonas pyrrhocoris TaxID=157538 RepID=A0A0N0VGD7_LEPPY|nr:putative Nuclear movement protein [Leptomonas pyrrhocoris]XP_015661499.1 putative Nuclear movement protein [Leptomonas pyrrhocoris]XP_015661500.1 putative Nuclear movement protein [Leptomonas pyrrhocoris]KPA83059.1 putative Nuclear movement protein [Leptomonas pyrrhocoris]KPA83060.1 putative Nuclear movement protein [Leptomonas pyrrhocoris]KPA83061.1 putative Nuclear movement protein [Leptomonas pyrrhocoris]|eukprot:XP_015661498.1 putative Nuclear movement protein [Leptomonas pyrrhocoris]
MAAVASQEGLTDLLPSNEQCGGDYPLYSFGQTDREVTVTVLVPPGTRAKSLQVEIKAKHLRVEVPSEGVILDGELYKPVNVDESTWCMQDGKELIVTLTKTNMQYEEWWPLVVLGERQIDMKTLKPPSIRFSELDDGAQATVAKMMHEQQQKREEGTLNPA